MFQIDLRSDTVTRPTYGMYKAMNRALLGDDVFEDDPTIKMLENDVAKLFGKEAALFFPTGTMCNLASLLTWCPNRGSEIIVGNKSHIFLFEQSGAAQFGGISPRNLPNLPDGTIDIDLIKSSIRDDDIHEPSTKLICIENTHNACGGVVLPLHYLQSLKKMSEETNIPIHMDGARIWNAITYLNVSPKEISKYVDSMSVCLSKGLGAPIGSLLVGPSQFILKARRIRKALGGGMRQVGILGAAGLVAINDFKDNMLYNDHKNNLIVYHSIKDTDSFIVKEPQTNILFIELNTKDNNIVLKIKEYLKEQNILVSFWEPFLMRIVIHRDITVENIDLVVKAFKEIDKIIKNV